MEIETFSCLMALLGIKYQRSKDISHIVLWVILGLHHKGNDINNFIKKNLFNTSIVHSDEVICAQLYFLDCNRSFGLRSCLLHVP